MIMLRYVAVCCEKEVDVLFHCLDWRSLWGVDRVDQEYIAIYKGKVSPLVTLHIVIPILSSYR